MRLLRTPVPIRPTRLDAYLANTIAKHAQPVSEHTLEAVTWGADAKVLMAASAIASLAIYLHKPGQRPLAVHMLSVTLAAALLPHGFKAVVDQTRPDRLTVRGHWRGIPISGNRRDAFPSGHAVHMGALASMSGLFPKPWPAILWTAATALSRTRVALLAHWASDVAAGFALGVGLERLMRRLTLSRLT